jgi:hypothetical protein
VILRSKLNQRAWHPANMRPWALGLNARILEATRDAPPIAERRRSVLINFGASHPFAHATREHAARVFEPRLERVIDIDRTVDDLTREPAAAYDALMWRQTGHRFSRAYYERLKSSQAVACFCGDMIPAAPFAGADRYLAGGNRAKLRRLLYEAIDWVDRRPQRAIQWDSFRFWEALAAGCAAINIDLEKYGVALPEMPVNWSHYIGIDFDRPDDAVARIAGDSGLLERVGTAGRQWAMEHYSPRAMAARLLEWAA